MRTTLLLVLTAIALFLTGSTGLSAGGSEGSISHGDSAQVAPCLEELAALDVQNLDWVQAASRYGCKIEDGKVLVEADANLQTNVWNEGAKVREPYVYGEQVFEAIKLRFPALVVIPMGTDTRFRAWVAPREIPDLALFVQSYVKQTVIQPALDPKPCFGSINSEGPNAVGVSGYPAPSPTGTGVKVAVFDVGYAGIAAAAAEVGAWTSPQGTIGSGTQVHGTACAEIIRDMAPNCQLRLYDLSSMSFLSATQEAISWGAQVISVSLSAPGYPGEGDACDAARLAKQNGIHWVNSAGNYGDRQYWERQNPPVNGSNMVEMTPGVTLNQVTYSSYYNEMWINFANEQPSGSYARFQVILYADSGSGPVQVAAGTAGATSQQLYYAPTSSSATYYIGIRRTQTGNVGRMRFQLWSGGRLTHYSTVGSISNPGTLDNEVITIGAVNYSSYTASGSPASYSSRGGGIWNMPLDFCAPTQCSTYSYGASGFNGTSCSCPNTSGLLALQLSHPSFQGNPYNTLQLVNLGAAGWDTDTGWGIVKAPTQASGSNLTLYQNTPALVSSTPTNVTLTPQTYFWNAVAVSSPATSDWNLQMAGSTSSAAAGQCDFLLQNGNLATVSGTGVASRASGSGSGTAEHAGLSSMAPGSSVGFSLAGTHIVHLWELYVTTAASYPITLSTSGSAGIRWYVYSANAGTSWTGASGATFGPFTPSSTAQNLNLGVTGYWAIIAVLDGGPGATDTVTVNVGNPVSVPLVSVSTSALNLGVVTQGSAGSTSTYTVSGSNLTNDIALSAPSSIELSLSGAAGTFTPSLVLYRSGSQVLSTTVYARIAASAPQGSISGNIAHASSGAATKNVSVSGSVQPPAVPSIVVSVSTLDLGATTQGSAGATFNYTVTGTALNGDITVTAPTGVQVSLNGTVFSGVVTLVRSGSSVPTTNVYTRISAAAATGAITGNIAHASSGATTRNVAMTGTVVAPGSAVISVSKASIDLESTCPGWNSGTPKHYTVSGSGLISDIILTAPSYVFLSIPSDTSWTQSKTLLRSGSVVAPVVVNVMIMTSFGYVGPISGNIAHAATGAATKSVSVTGNSLPDTSPNISMTPNGGRSPVDLGTRSFGGSSSPTMFTVYSRNLSQDVIIHCPAGYEVSYSGYDWEYYTDLAIYKNQSVSVLVRQARDASVGANLGDISASCPGAPFSTLSIQGTVTAPVGPTMALSVQALNGMNNTDIGVASIPSVYRVSGAGLTGNITLAAPTDFEISKTGYIGSYGPSVVLNQSGGSVPSSPIYVRIAASVTTAGAKTGSISHSTSGTANLGLPVGGSVGNGASWGILLSSTFLALGTSEVGQTGADLTYNVSTTGATAAGQMTIVAPPEVEIAIQFSGFPVGSYGQVAVNTPPFIVHVRTRKTTPETQFTGRIRHALFNCNDRFVNVTGEVVAATNPTVYLYQPVLDYSLSCQQGSSSQPCTYSLRGYALTADLVITPPTGLEVSINGTNYFPSLSLTPTSGSVPQTQIYCRMSSAATGTSSGIIGNASAGAVQQNVNVQWRAYPTEAVFCTLTHVNLASTVQGTPSTAVTFQVSAVNCPTRLDINPAGETQISFDGINFGGALQSAYSTGGVIPPTTVYMRLNPNSSSAAGYRLLGNLIVVGNTSAISIPVSGTVELAPTRGFEVTSPVGGEIWQAGTTHVISWNAFGQQGYYVNIELSQDSGTTWTPEIVPFVPVTPTIYNWTIPATTPPGTTYRIRVRASGSSHWGISAGDFTITAAPPAIVNASPSSLNLGSTVQGQAGSTVGAFDAGGDLLGTIPITITPPAGVEIRNASAAGTFSSNAILLMPSSGSVAATNIEARIAASAVASQSFGDITLTSGGTTVNVSIAGTVTNPPPGVSVSTNNIGLGTTVQGVAGTTTGSYQLTGSNLTQDLVVTPPAGVEIRDAAGGAFATSALTFVPVSGSVSKTLEVRIAAGASAGQSFADITNVSGPASQNVSISGTVTSPPSLNATPGALNLGATQQGTAGSAVDSYAITGSNLSANVVITPPTGVEIRDAAGGTFAAAPLNFVPSGGVVSVTIEARIAASALAGQGFGDITNVCGTISMNVTIAGTVTSPPPSLNVAPSSLSLGVTTEGTAGSAFSFVISGSNLSANVIVTPPAGVEIRDAAGGTFSTLPLSFAPVSGAVSATVEVRISSAALAGQVFGVVSNVSSALSQDVTLAGTVNAAQSGGSKKDGGESGGCTTAEGAGAAWMLAVLMLLWFVRVRRIARNR